MRDSKKKNPLYQQIYKIVCLIPEGKVASYGQIAAMLNRCTPRMVGYAMTALPSGSDVPWHRVINSQGKISVRAGGDGGHIQRLLLEAEEVEFNADEKINFEQVSWKGPEYK